MRLYEVRLWFGGEESDFLMNKFRRSGSLLNGPLPAQPRKVNSLEVTGDIVVYRNDERLYRTAIDGSSHPRVISKR